MRYYGDLYQEDGGRCEDGSPVVQNGVKTSYLDFLQ